MSGAAELQSVVFETSLGPIPVRGLAEAFGRPGPCVLVITGAFAPDQYMIQMPLLGEERWDGFVAKLPGNQTPVLSQTSIAAFAAAFDEVVKQLDRPVVVLGVSVGALVALGMQSQRATVALEPFLTTAGLWPVWPKFSRGESPAIDEFLDAIFGLTERGVEGRDYNWLLQHLVVPTEVVVGDVPLEPRRAWSETAPSLVSEDDRRTFARHPRISLTVAPGAGHNVWWSAGRFVLGRLELIMAGIAKTSRQVRSPRA